MVFVIYIGVYLVGFIVIFLFYYSICKFFNLIGLFGKSWVLLWNRNLSLFLDMGIEISD